MKVQPTKQRGPKSETNGRRFYYASSYNLPGIFGGGAKTAQLAIPRLERHFGAKCTSRWPFDHAHGEPWYARKAAETDVESVRSADFIVFAPLTKTSRGTHVEMGLALALGKPVFGRRFAEGDDGTAFDALGKPLDMDASDIIAAAMRYVTEKFQGRPATIPPSMPTIQEVHDAKK